jgi:hypothetical protein
MRLLSFLCPDCKQCSAHNVEVLEDGNVLVCAWCYKHIIVSFIVLEKEENHAETKSQTTQDN